MLIIPPALQAQFEECLRDKAIPKKTHGSYKKWLRGSQKHDGFGHFSFLTSPFVTAILFQAFSG